MKGLRFDGILDLASTLARAPRAESPGKVLNLVAKLARCTRAQLNDPIRHGIYAGRADLQIFAPCVGAQRVK